jgi:hypothetical protein
MHTTGMMFAIFVAHLVSVAPSGQMQVGSIMLPGRYPTRELCLAAIPRNIAALYNLPGAPRVQSSDELLVGCIGKALPAVPALGGGA